MKRIQILFAAIVAVLAMSFTFAGKANLLGHSMAKAFVSDGCYTSVTVSTTPNPTTITSANASSNQCTTVPIPQTCSSSTVTISGAPTPYTLGPSGTLPAVTNATGLINPSTSCPSPYNNFCCYKIVSNHVTAIVYRS